MIWARVALAGGLCLLALAFAFGTEDQRSASVLGQNYDCGATISASWLVPGTPDQTLNPGPGATAEQRRASSACSPVIHQARVMILTTMAVACLLALIGWTALREQAEPVHA
jgi:hypothetical protein